MPTIKTVLPENSINKSLNGGKDSETFLFLSAMCFFFLSPVSLFVFRFERAKSDEHSFAIFWFPRGKIVKCYKTPATIFSDVSIIIWVKRKQEYNMRGKVAEKKAESVADTFFMALLVDFSFWQTDWKISCENCKQSNLIQECELECFNQLVV